jgi:Predicted Fe-S oxidoreductases
MGRYLKHMKKIKQLSNLSNIYFSYISRKEKCNYLPVRLWVETSARCNLACRLCINKDIDASLKGDMDLGFFKKIIDDACGYVFDVNLFHRGEPLLNKNIVEMVQYAHSKNIKTRIHTNGTLLNSGLSESLIRAGLNFISFSVDGYTKETYEKNRINAKYDSTMENISGFLKVKKQLGLKTPFTVVQVMEFDESLSKEEFQSQKTQFIKKFDGLGLDKLTIRTPHNWGGLLEIDGLRKIDRKKDKLIPCTFPWYSITVFYNGMAYLCPQDFEGEIPLGDLNKVSLKEIFNNDIIRAVRNRFKNKDVKDLSPCNNCDRIWRQTVAGIPKEYLKAFLKDNIRKN